MNSKLLALTDFILPVFKQHKYYPINNNNNENDDDDDFDE